MKTLLQPRLFPLWILPLLACAATLVPRARAEGTAGARGGGTGILCRGDVSPVTIEEQVIRENGRELRVPETREEVEHWLRRRLRFRIPSARSAFASSPGWAAASGGAPAPSTYADAAIAVWARLGSYESWPTIDRSGILDLLARPVRGEGPVDRDGLIASFRALLDRFGVQAVAQPEPLVSDDFYETPVGCRKLQLSVLADGRVFRVEGSELSARTRRMLELHETFYQLGMAALQLEAAAGARDYLAGIASGSGARSSTVEFFDPRGTEPSAVLGFDPSRIYALRDGFADCPIVLSFSVDPARRYVAYLERPAMTPYARPGQVSLDGEIPSFMNRGRCSYEAVRLPAAGIGPGGVGKLWRAFLLSRQRFVPDPR